MKQQNNMRQLSPLQQKIFTIGGALMVIGIGMFVFQLWQTISAIIFFIGTILFAVMQSLQTYSGKDIRIQRLRNMLGMASILFVVSGILMIDTATTFLRPLFTNHITYIEYIYNKWIVVLLVAVVLEVYSTHAISKALKM